MRVSRTTPAPALQEAFNGHEPPRSESFFLSPSGKKADKSRGRVPQRQFSPSGGPNSQQEPPHPHVEVSSMLLSIPLFFHTLLWVLFNLFTLSYGFCSITCTIQCIIYMWSLQFIRKKKNHFFVITLTSQSVPELQPEPHLSEVRLWQLLPLQNLPLCIYRL